MDTLDTVIEATEEGMNHGGFASADLPGQKDKALSLHDPVYEKVKGLFVGFAKVEKPR